ncbi:MULTISPECIES: hypothetical protein [Flavobacterium]|uniref:hypothetical protein n=1 Tax=Flavobacterium TaxID=237 RepID=UPI001FCB0807|nr:MULTISPECIES: hypothetical protein [Flavobacterium]UOK42534.1 hypothetical protein LZF87_14655 [Flavobacterium enshiense]
MKKITTILLLSLSLHSFSQTTETKIENTNASVEKSIFGIQTGLIGLWVYNELKLSDKFALRSELGLQFATVTKEDSNDSYTFLTPEITLEPRFYYNLNKRSRNRKNISKNSGNYFSLRSSYYPDSFTIGNDGGYNFVPELNIVPTWGMKRNLGSHFDYELGGGIGYRTEFEKADAKNSNNSDVTMYIHARIGYKF